MKIRIKRPAMFRCIVAVMASAALVGCDDAAARREQAAKAQSSATVPSATRPSAISSVMIDNFSFNPPQITIAAGTRVTWTNHDDVPHTVTADDHKFSSGALETDQQFSRVFDTPGTYSYYCAVHPHMTGKVIVK
jgi:plastocyanin